MLSVSPVRTNRPTEYIVCFVSDEGEESTDVQQLLVRDDASAVSWAEWMLARRPKTKGFTLMGPQSRIVAMRGQDALEATQPPPLAQLS